MSKKVCEGIQKMNVPRRAGTYFTARREQAFMLRSGGGGGQRGLRSSVAVSWAHIPFGMAPWPNSHTAPLHWVSNP